MSTKQSTGAEKAVWDLVRDFYSGLEDPQLQQDIDTWLAGVKGFYEQFKGHLHEDGKLGDALVALAQLNMLEGKAGQYFSFLLTQNTGDEPAKKKLALARKVMSQAEANYLEFFKHEVLALDKNFIEKQASSDAVVAHHLPALKNMRLFKPHLLTEEVESALTKRGHLGVPAWEEYYEKYSSNLRFAHRARFYNRQRQLDLEEALHVMSQSKNAKERARLMKTLNDGFVSSHFLEYATETLNQVIEDHEIEDRERGYKHPMEQRNKSSLVPSEVVEAQHDVGIKKAGPLAQTFYRLKKAHLGLSEFRWSDRNAQMPFADSTIVPWDKALALVLESYEKFSPTMAAIARSLVADGRIDAAPRTGKRGGGYSSSFCLPLEMPASRDSFKGRAASFVHMNYYGSKRDVMTLAHELGHSVHGILGCGAQGPLQSGVAMWCAETASVFGERLVYEQLKAELKKKGDVKALLALNFGKLDDTLNTVVRQLNFSLFERDIHGHDGATLTRKNTQRLSSKELDAAWLRSRVPFYGEDGKVIKYGNDEHLWCYVPHFHDPFYVYAYSFGDTLVNSLFAVKDTVPNFEAKYLDALRAVGTKDVVQLTAPFGLDPTSRKFWEDGIRVSIEEPLNEAIELSKQIGVTI